MNYTSRCILACDGGGIRGLITAVMLERLEHKLSSRNPNKLLRDYFDLIAGTSTGSIIACGVAKGIDTSRIRQLYVDEGITIFPRFWNVFKSLTSRIRLGYSQPIYDGKGLEQVLQAVFRDDCFGDLPVPTLVTSYDTWNRRAAVFISTKAEFAQLPIWEICRASAAAPVAFPAHPLKNKALVEFWEQSGCTVPTYRGAKTIPLIDGGVFANDPAMCAVADRLSWQDEPSRKGLIVASFGTGQDVKEIGVEQALGWGGLEWASPRKGIPFMDVMFDGSADAVGYALGRLLQPANYYRFQPTIDDHLPAFNANPGKIRQLQQVALTFLDQPAIDEKLNNLAEMLLSRSSIVMAG